MIAPARLRCDQCGGEFDNAQTRREREKGIETESLVCPHCETQYLICRTNPEIRRLRKRVRAYRTLIEKRRADGTFKENHMRRLLSMMDELRGKTNEFNEK